MFKKIEINELDFKELADNVNTAYWQARNPYGVEDMQEALRKYVFNVKPSAKFNPRGWNKKGTKIPEKHYGKPVVIRKENSDDYNYLIGFLGWVGDVCVTNTARSTILEEEFEYKLLD